MYKIIARKFVAFEYSYLTILTIFQIEEMQTSEPRVTLSKILSCFKVYFKSKNVRYI